MAFFLIRIGLAWLVACAAGEPPPPAIGPPEDPLCLEGEMPAPPASRTRNPSWYLSLNQFRRLSARTPWAVVDVRPEREFRKLRIPGSVNVPAAFLKTSGFLTGKNVLLVNDGRTYREMETLIPLLSEVGAVQARILDGGLRRWAAEMEGTDRALVGDKDRAPAWNRLPAMALVAEIVYSNWLIVDTSVGADTEKSLPVPGSVALPFAQAKAFVKRLAALIRAKTEKQPLISVLIVDRDAKRYAAIEAAVGSAKLKNVLFLEGGRGTYQEAIQVRDLTVESAAEYAKPLHPNPCKRPRK